MILKILGVVLLVAGVLVLVYHGFSIPKQHQAKLGPLELSVQEKENVNIPTWLGLAGIALGVVLLVIPGKK